jgi:hypothetical protein
LQLVSMPAMGKQLAACVHEPDCVQGVQKIVHALEDETKDQRKQKCSIPACYNQKATCVVVGVVFEKENAWERLVR